jgi:nucleoside-diphosphate-sugar epimerase
VRRASVEDAFGDVVRGDLSDVDAVTRACEGVTTVVHLAARVHVMRDRSADPLAEFRRENVEATRRLMQAAAIAGVRRVLFVSSVKAVGESSERPWTDDVTPAPRDPYGQSKLEAEHVVRTIADAAGVDAPILRLPLVYGPGMRANMLRLFQLVDRGVPLPVGAVRNRRSLLYVENVAAAILAALRSPAASRETFFVSDGEDVSTPELVERVARALDRRARLLPIAPKLFRYVGRVGDALSAVLPFPVTTAAVDRLLGSLAVDSTRLRLVTGFAPPVSLDEGLRRTAAWYRATNVPRSKRRA